MARGQYGAARQRLLMGADAEAASELSPEAKLELDRKLDRFGNRLGWGVAALGVTIYWLGTRKKSKKEH